MPRPTSARPVEWRDFERLVARIERALSSDSVTIESPARIRSLVTGRKREVDVAVTTTVGSASVLITIECRKRGSVQDVTWIEQLASKRLAIGAAKTIAVASSDFSGDAIKAARHYGIDLRVAARITDLDLRGWILPQSLIHIFKRAAFIDRPEAEFVLEPEESLTQEDLAGLISTATPISAKVFTTSDGLRLSIDDIWQQADQVLKIFDSVPTDNEEHVRRIRLVLVEPLFLDTPRGPRRVHALKLALSLRWQFEEIPLASASVVEYRQVSDSGSSNSVLRAEFDTKEGTHSNIRFGFQTTSGSNDATFSVQPLPPKRDA